MNEDDKMPRTDSTHAMQSLMTYEDSEGEDEANSSMEDASALTKAQAAPSKDVNTASLIKPSTSSPMKSSPSLATAEVTNSKKTEKESVVAAEEREGKHIDADAHDVSHETEKASDTNQVMVDNGTHEDHETTDVHDKEGDTVLSGHIHDSDEDEEKSPIKDKKVFSTIDLDSHSNQASPMDATAVAAQQKRHKAARLVSYGMEELDDAEDDEEPARMEGLPALLEDMRNSDKQLPPATTLDERRQRLRSLIPPPPPGHCSKHLEDKLVPLFKRKLQHGMDLNAKIQNKKEFRNPSIYEKLILFCGIDENGTNYPPNVFDPHQWKAEEFYDELARAQKLDMDKREAAKKDRKKVEFISGVKKPTPPVTVAPATTTTAASTAAAGPKKKSKWDQETKQ